MPKRTASGGKTAARAAKKSAPRKKAPAKKPKAADAAGGARLVVKQIKSGIGHAKTYRRTLEALGLRHHQAEIVIVDNPSIRGMLYKVHHLVSVRPQGA